MSTIKITGWKAGGPVYEIHRRSYGWANRRNRVSVEVVDPGGKNQKRQPDYHLATIDGDEYLMLNAGHLYDLDMVVHGDDQLIVSDARGDYQIVRLGDGIELAGVAEHSDDEDSVSDAGDAIGEEE